MEIVRLGEKMNSPVGQQVSDSTSMCHVCVVVTKPYYQPLGMHCSLFCNSFYDGMSIFGSSCVCGNSFGRGNAWRLELTTASSRIRLLTFLSGSGMQQSDRNLLAHKVNRITSMCDPASAKARVSPSEWNPPCASVCRTNHTHLDRARASWQSDSLLDSSGRGFLVAL